VRGIFLIMTCLTVSVGVAHADCLREVEVFREHVDSLKPTRATAAAARELERIDQADAESEVQCYDVLAHARDVLNGEQTLAGPVRDNAKQPDRASGENNRDRHLGACATR
jgi:hypothetical protein